MSWELVVSDPGDPVVMYADIEGESDNPSPIGWRGSGAAVAELNMTLSLTSEVGPRLPEMISADNPNSSADAPDGRQGQVCDLQKGQYAYLQEETCHDPRLRCFPMKLSEAASSLKPTRRLFASTRPQVHLYRYGWRQRRALTKN